MVELNERAAKLLREYRPSIPEDVLHLWAKDCCELLSALSQQPAAEPPAQVEGKPVAWTTQAQLDGIAGTGNNGVMWGEPLPYHPDIPLYATPPVPSGLVDALQECAWWLDGALTCKTWSWDADQREAATSSLQKARAALASTVGGE